VFVSHGLEIRYIRLNFITEKLSGEVLVWKERENLLSTVCALVSECEVTQITLKGRRTNLFENSGAKSESGFGNVNYRKNREI
jgi:hypothetical protein